MNRRDAIMGLGAAGMAVALSAHAETSGKQPSETSPLSRETAEAIQAAALDCVRTGERCIQHCYEMLSGGDTSMADCARRVHDVLAICEAMARLASAGSDKAPAMAKVCAQACKDCLDVCLKHKKHPPCAACADSCQKALQVLARA
jgi:Cys-rich four helix bundle protein (predicted Tat secretion target)